MPIPGDNGQPKLEREKQEARFTEVAETGATLKSELMFKGSDKEPMIHLDGGIYKR